MTRTGKMTMPTMERKCRRHPLPTAIGAAALLIASSLGGCSSSPTGQQASSTVNPGACGLSALTSATKPVQITMWHELVRTNNDWLVSSTNEFNNSQDKVHVTLVQQPDYPSLFQKYKAGLSTGDLPDVAQFEDTTVQQLIDSGSTVPVQDCIDASRYSLSDYLPRTLKFYSYQGVQRSMPWAVSNVVLYYDPGKFAKAGLDPNKPPQTLDEVMQDSRKIVASGAATHGIALHAQPYVFEYLLAKSGGEYVNNGNGRVSRAAAANLTSAKAMKIWDWWNQMVKSGLALNTGSDPNSIDHFLAIGTGSAAMTFEASGVIGPVEAVLNSGQYPGVQVATAPLPALTAGGGVPVGDGSLWISNRSSLAKRAAAWKFIQYLDSPAEQASLAAEGGYVPVRVSATHLPVLVNRWTQDPNYKVGYTQLTQGTLSYANIGSLIGDYQGVRNAVTDGLVQMLSNGQSPAAAAALAEREANTAIGNYNARIGAG
jgi:sn-glycerol 3-phosphate transport system substrate-binding protein